MMEIHSTLLWKWQTK